MSNVNSQSQNENNTNSSVNNRISQIENSLNNIRTTLVAMNPSSGIPPPPPNSGGNNNVNNNSNNSVILACHDWEKAKSLRIKDNILPEGVEPPVFKYKETGSRGDYKSAI